MSEGDYLLAWTAIAERLGDQVTDVPTLTAPDLAFIEEKNQKLPAFYVHYDGDVVPPAGEAGNGKAQILAQRFTIVLAVKNLQGSDQAKGLIKEAGPLAWKALKALGGWQPSPMHRALVRVPNAARPTFATGFGYFPYTFETRLIIS